jgi:5-methylcytosine-specific restriction endonuclease McrA
VRRPYDNTIVCVISVRRLIQRDGPHCWLCGEPVDQTKIGVGSYAKRKPSRDHFVPRAAGGSNAPENIRLAHQLCNWERHIRYPETLRFPE